jgi:hypothetical protein
VLAALGMLMTLGVLAPPATLTARATPPAKADATAHSHRDRRRPPPHTRTRSTSIQHHLARRAIVGGTQIAVQQAPWQVEVEAQIPIPASELVDIVRCGGSILDAIHVLTAAHCMFTSASHTERTPPQDLVVHAGTSDLLAPEVGEQNVAVAVVRVHPYYANVPNSGPDPDDVAVLTLSEPLVPGPAASPIALASLGSIPQAGATVNITGFGEQNPTEEHNGKLYSLGMALESSRTCGEEDDAVILCASSPVGSSCNGDSGSGLTAPASPPALVGVENTGAIVSGHKCAIGSRHSFADVAAPEIQDFIEGSETPPRAPRGGGASCPTTSPVVGETLTCQAGAWSGEPTLAYTFLDGATGQVLQSGPSPGYRVAPAEVGHTIVLQAQATNAGGTGVDQTPPTPPIGMAATLPSPAPGGVSLAGTGLVVQRGMAQVRLDCTEREGGCRGRLTLSARRTYREGKGRRSRTVTIGTAGFSIPGGETTTVKVELNAAGRALLHADHGRLDARLTILELEPEPARTQTESVRLVQRTAARHSSKRRRR